MGFEHIILIYSLEGTPIA